MLWLAKKLKSGKRGIVRILTVRWLDYLKSDVVSGFRVLVNGTVDSYRFTCLHGAPLFHLHFSNEIVTSTGQV